MKPKILSSERGIDYESMKQYMTPASMILELRQTYLQLRTTQVSAYEEKGIGKRGYLIRAEVIGFTSLLLATLKTKLKQEVERRRREGNSPGRC